MVLKIENCFEVYSGSRDFHKDYNLLPIQVICTKIKKGGRTRERERELKD